MTQFRKSDITRKYSYGKNDLHQINFNIICLDAKVLKGEMTYPQRIYKICSQIQTIITRRALVGTPNPIQFAKVIGESRPYFSYSLK